MSMVGRYAVSRPGIRRYVDGYITSRHSQTAREFRVFLAMPLAWRYFKSSFYFIRWNPLRGKMWTKTLTELYIRKPITDRLAARKPYYILHGNFIAVEVRRSISAALVCLQRRNKYI